ncbi:MAG: DoxX family protein [Gammaproteobacteria bacterium]
MTTNSANIVNNKSRIFAFWIVRLTLGISFFFHGWGKLPLPPEKLTSWFENIGMLYPDIIASLVSLGEIGAGIGIIIGGLLKGNIGEFITRLSAFSIFVIMIGAFYLAHSDWFINENLFKSEQIYIFVLSIFFLINGNNR